MLRDRRNFKHYISHHSLLSINLGPPTQHISQFKIPVSKTLTRKLT